MTHLKPILLSKELIDQGIRDGLVFNQNTETYGVYVDRVLVGYTGFMSYGNKIIFKNHYVLPEYRRKGYFRRILDLSIAYAKVKGYTRIEATCTPMSISEYKKRGAVTLEKYKNGCEKVALGI